MASPSQEARTRLHRVHLARLQITVVNKRSHGSTRAFIDTHPNAIQSPFLFPPQHASKTSDRLCGNSNVRRRSALCPTLHRSTLLPVKYPIIILAGLRLNSIYDHGMCGRRKRGERTALQYHMILHWVQRLRPVGGAGETQDEQKCSRFLVERT